MTALCSGGTSSSKPEFNEFVQISTYAVGALLNNVGTTWAVPLAAVIGLVNYDLSIFCTTDPPAMPTISATDVVDLLSPLQGSAYFAARQKFQDLIANYAWPQFCKCDTGPQPSLPAPVAQPTNMPNINPVTPVTPDPSASTPCFHWDHDTLPFGIRSVDFSAGTTYPQFIVLAIPPGTTGMRFYYTWSCAGSCGAVIVKVGYQFKDASGAVVHNYPAANQASPAAFEVFIPVDATATSVQVAYTAPTGQPSNYVLQLNVDGYCDGGGPGGTSSGCCPPDETVLAILNNIQTVVNLIQRQAAPFAYITSTAHTDLSGSGSIDVSQLLGARIELTAIGHTVGIEDGDTEVYWDAGWINWSNADGATHREFIGASPLVSLPMAAGVFTRISYSLPVGVTATITELVREP